MRKSLFIVLALAGVLAGGWQYLIHHAAPDRSLPVSTSASAAATAAATSEAKSAIARARATLIEQKTAELVGAPRTVELTSGKAQQARNAINAGDFDTADRISGEVLAHSQLRGWSFYPFNIFIGGLLDLATPQYESRLGEWHAKEPNKPMPLMIRAAYYQAAAWRARGAHFARKTQVEHMRAFSTQLAKALQDVVAALALDQSNPWPYYLHLSILAGHGQSENIEHAFQEAIAKFPDYYPLYTEQMGTLQPKWGGSVPLLVDFVDTHAGGARAGSPLKLLYLELYSRLLNVASIACRSPEEEQRPECITAVLEKILPDSLNAHVTESLALYKSSDPYFFSEAVGRVLSGVVTSAETKKYGDALMQMASDAMGTENQLLEERPGHNNYRLDAIVAQVWQREEHNDNAETKYQEAIRDMAGMRFPGEEARLIALAELYASLADVYRDKSQFEDAIAYHRAAEALGGPSFANYTLVCYCFYRMKEFDSAFAECDSLYKRYADLDALYWRAKTQEKRKHTAAAIADYTVIAESEHGWRTTAVINLSVLVHDPQRELEIFEKYPYVFDEEDRSRGDLAVVYNNRCYAYKQLGQLDKALEDCNTSLKFGNIPDALAKKRDIEKRLKAQERRA